MSKYVREIIKYTLFGVTIFGLSYGLGVCDKNDICRRKIEKKEEQIDTLQSQNDRLSEIVDSLKREAIADSVRYER